MKLSLCAVIISGCLSIPAVYAASPAPHLGIPNQASLQGHVQQLPLHFEPNRGQSSGQVKFLARGPGYTLFLTPDEVALSLTKPRTKDNPPTHGDVVRMRFVDGGAEDIIGQRRLPGVSNYLTGSDARDWRLNVPHYATVKSVNVYPGVDVIYYGSQRRLEYDFIVAPGADPARIRLAFAGVEALNVDAEGNLIMHTGGGELVQHRPTIYQTIDGKKIGVEGEYVVEGEQVGFHIAAYDPKHTLIIDPVLAYSSYLGGASFDYGFGVATGADGSAYLVGATASADFPVTAGVHAANFDAFVAKLNATGNALVYSTFLGGADYEAAFNITLDAAGDAYVVGYTESTNFPTTPGAHDRRCGTDGTCSPNQFGLTFDAFAVKLNSAGVLRYSTYLGGGGDDRATGVAVDAAGNAYLTGNTTSIDFPTLHAYQGTIGGGFFGDAFVTKLNATGSGLLYSTYLGGGGDEGNGAGLGGAIAVDAGGHAYVTGYTTSTDFPTKRPFQAALRGFTDAFVTKLAPGGNTLEYSTYLGGSFGTVGRAIAVDRFGRAHVAGDTSSSDFPTKNARQAANRGATDAFVTRFSAAGNTLVYSTYLGGRPIMLASGDSYGGDDSATGIALDADGNVYIAGQTNASGFPVTSNALDKTCGTDARCNFIWDLDGPSLSSDAFLVKLGANGTTLLYGTYVGGSAADGAQAVAVDARNNIYLAGYTESANWPTTRGALDRGFNGEADAFIVKFGEPGRAQFKNARYAVNEASGRAVIRVERVGGSYGTLVVHYQAGNGTAVAGSDYSATGGALRWVDGDTTAKSFSVPIVNDNAAEPNETLRLSLTASRPAASIGAPNKASLIIIDND